ncbi:MAG: hypothetical protein ACOCW6_04990 [Spirochaetota bacterium]
MRHPTRLLGAVLLVVSCLSPRNATALEFQTLDINFGQLWIGNAYKEDEAGDPIQGSDVSPLNLAGGVGTLVEIVPGVTLNPAVDFFWQEYLLTESGKVVPTQIETGTAVGPIAGSLGIILSVPYVHSITVSEELELALGASPSFLLRFPLRPIEGSDTGELSSYFYSSGRFFYPELQTKLFYSLTDTASLGFSLRIFVPVHNLWDEYDVAFWDELMIFPQIAVRIHS